MLPKRAGSSSLPRPVEDPQVAQNFAAIISRLDRAEQVVKPHGTVQASVDDEGRVSFSYAGNDLAKSAAYRWNVGSALTDPTGATVLAEPTGTVTIPLATLTLAEGQTAFITVWFHDEPNAEGNRGPHVLAQAGRGLRPANSPVVEFGHMRSPYNPIAKWIGTARLVGDPGGNFVKFRFDIGNGSGFTDAVNLQPEGAPDNVWESQDFYVGGRDYPAEVTIRGMLVWDDDGTLVEEIHPITVTETTYPEALDIWCLPKLDDTAALAFLVNRRVTHVRYLWSKTAMPTDDAVAATALVSVAGASAHGVDTPEVVREGETLYIKVIAYDVEGNASDPLERTWQRPMANDPDGSIFPTNYGDDGWIDVKMQGSNYEARGIRYELVTGAVGNDALMPPDDPARPGVVHVTDGQGFNRGPGTAAGYYEKFFDNFVRLKDESEAAFIRAYFYGDPAAVGKYSSKTLKIPGRPQKMQVQVSFRVDGNGRLILRASRVYLATHLAYAWTEGSNQLLASEAPTAASAHTVAALDASGDLVVVLLEKAVPGRFYHLRYYATTDPAGLQPRGSAFTDVALGPVTGAEITGLTSFLSMVPNASMEVDTNDDGFPDNWSYLDSVEGTRRQLTDAWAVHGERSLEIQGYFDGSAAHAARVCTQPIAVRAAERYHFAAAMRNPTASTIGGKGEFVDGVTMFVRWYGDFTGSITRATPYLAQNVLWGRADAISPGATIQEAEALSAPSTAKFCAIFFESYETGLPLQIDRVFMLSDTSGELHTVYAYDGALKAGVVVEGSGRKLAQMANSQQGVFLETWEGDASQWHTVAANGAAEIVSTGGLAGGRVFQGTAHQWWEWKYNIAFDPSKLYRLRARIRQTAAGGAQGAYIGLVGIAGDGVTRVNVSGANSSSSQHYVTLNGSAIAADGVWREYTGWIKGHGTYVAQAADPLNPSGMHADVRYVRPLFIVNYSASDGVAQVDEIAIDVFDENAASRLYLGLDANGLVSQDVPRGRALAEVPGLDSITGLVHRGATTVDGAVIATVEEFDTGNMVKNPNFEAALNGSMPDHWAMNYAGGTVTVTTAQKWVGTRSVQLTPGGVSNTVSILSAPIRVRELEELFVGVNVLAPSGTPSNGFYLRVYFYTDEATYSGFTNIIDGAATVLTPGSWVFLSGMVAPAAGINFIRVELIAEARSAASLYCDAVRLFPNTYEARRRLDGFYYADRVLQATVLQTDTVQQRVLTRGQVGGTARHNDAVSYQYNFGAVPAVEVRAGVGYQPDPNLWSTPSSYLSTKAQHHDLAALNSTASGFTVRARLVQQGAAGTAIGDQFPTGNSVGTPGGSTALYIESLPLTQADGSETSYTITFDVTAKNMSVVVAIESGIHIGGGTYQWTERWRQSYADGTDYSNSSSWPNETVVLLLSGLEGSAQAADGVGDKFRLAFYYGGHEPAPSTSASLHGHDANDSPAGIQYTANAADIFASMTPGANDRVAWTAKLVG